MVALARATTTPSGTIKKAAAKAKRESAAIEAPLAAAPPAAAPAAASLPAGAPAAAPPPAADKVRTVDNEIRIAEAELAAGNAEAAFARLARLEELHGDTKAAGAGASGSAKPGAGFIKRANTMPIASLLAPVKVTSLPRGGTLCKLVGTKDELKALSLEKYKGRMGRVVEMVGRQFMQDGTTELVTLLLDSRTTDYDRGNGAWVQVPFANVELA